MQKTERKSRIRDAAPVNSATFLAQKKDKVANTEVR